MRTVWPWAGIRPGKAALPARRLPRREDRPGPDTGKNTSAHSATGVAQERLQATGRTQAQESMQAYETAGPAQRTAAQTTAQASAQVPEQTPGQSREQTTAGTQQVTAAETSSMADTMQTGTMTARTPMANTMDMTATTDTTEVTMDTMHMTHDMTDAHAHAADVKARCTCSCQGCTCQAREGTAETARGAQPDAQGGEPEAEAVQAAAPVEEAAPAAPARRRGRRKKSAVAKSAVAKESAKDAGWKDESGFTLVEVLGALVVGSLVFAFAAFGISGGLESARVSGFNESLALLRVNIHETYASSRGFGTSSTQGQDITSDLVDAGAIPQNWLASDGSTVVHNFGGSVSVTGTVHNFTITADAIPEAVCRKIVSSQLDGWDSISVGGAEVTELPATTCEPDEGGVGVNELTFLAH